MQWVIGLLVLLLYVHLFNAIAPLYFASESTLTLGDLWRHVVPPLGIQITL
jgi:hypothetical protein